ncbi:MAG: MarC family protein [Alphaproteobacteria bacterium]
MHLFITIFTMFFVMISPLSNMLIFDRLTSNFDAKAKKMTAYKSVIVGFLVLLGFGLTGEALFKTLAIEIDAFRICGGILLFIIALDMVFEKRVQRCSDTADKIVRDPTFEDISVFPMAIPLLAGPGSITSTILAMGKYHGDVVSQILIFVYLALVMLISLILFLYSSLLVKLIGETVNDIISRLLGILLAALSVQFVIDGVKGAFF